MPVVSANTQARVEGYFRLEWRLADQRTHLMGKSKAFIVPVCIDTTRDSDADVPDSFVAVQWTRLSAGETSAAFCERVKNLLSPKTEATRPPMAYSAPVTSAASFAPPAKPKSNRAWLGPALAGVAVIAAVAIWQPWKPSESTTASTLPAVAAKPAAPLSEARKLAARADAMFDQTENATRGDLDLAEGLCKQALVLDPNDAEIHAIYARLLVSYVTLFDLSPERRASARVQAEQAAKLAPDSDEAQLALANFYRLESPTRPDAERILRALVARRPDFKRAWRTLGHTLKLSNRNEEAIAIYQQTAALPGGDPLSLINAAQCLGYLSRFAEAEAVVDQLLASRPSANAYMMKASYATWRGDFPNAASALEQVPATWRLESFYVANAMRFWLWQHEPTKVLELLRAMPGDFIEGWGMNGPKDYYVGLALAMTQRPDAATVAWQAALQVVERRLTAQPTSFNLTAWKGVLFARLGQDVEARRLFALCSQMLGTGSATSLDVTARLLAARLRAGERGAVLEELKTSLVNNAFAFRSVVQFDPEFDGLRDEPWFKAAIESSVDSNKNSQPATMLPTPNEKSVAVLAFANLSDDKDNEYFSDGISEELLNVLAKIPDLKVTARTSSFSFKGKQVPLPEIARQLGVAYVVEGSVRKSGGKVRITAQLIKAADGFHVWSDNFDRELKDIFAVQDEIAGLIAKNLSLKLGMSVERAPADPEVFGLLLQGRFFARQESNAGRQQSIEFYRRAIGLESGYALAWAELAQSYIKLARFGGMPTADGVREARIAAEKSLGLDPDQPVALDALGWVQRTADWDWRGAQNTFQRAIALAPENAAILADASILYFNVGRTDEALALARKAVDRDPLNAIAQINLADLLTQSGHIPESLEPMNQGLKLAPGVEEFRAHFAIALAQIKHSAEADALIEQEPNESYRLWGRGMIAGVRGDQAGVSRVREALVAKNDATMIGYVAMLFIAEGKLDDAFAWLEHSFRERDSSICWVKNGIYYEPLRSDPRWPAFVRKLGLADEQLK